jgi:hypothetical protein
MRTSGKAGRSPRGSAMMVTVILMLVLLTLVAGLLAYSGQERIRGIYVARSLSRHGCVEAGLQLARAYYGRNFAQSVAGTGWSQSAPPPNFLTNSVVYNPVPLQAGFGNGTADPTSAAGLAIIAASNPQILVDLDNDQQPDVYLYIRDNGDEFPPAATPNPLMDNDQNAIIGAVCISQTLVPRRPDGTIDSDPLTSEGMLNYNLSGSTYGSQANGGASGTGNYN